MNSCRCFNFLLFDWFSEPITLSYQGRRRYRTRFGAVCTIMIFFICIALLAFVLYELLTEPDFTLK